MATLYDKMKWGFNGGAPFGAGLILPLKPTNDSANINVTRNGVARTVNEQGIIVEEAINVPRSYWYQGRSCPSWLIERESTNLFTYSENFNQWNKAFWTSVSFVDNTEISENGVYSLNVTSNSTSFKKVDLAVAKSINTEYTLSCFAKKNTVNYLILQPTGVVGGITNPVTWFDLEQGVVGESQGGVASITEMFNGWYRCSITFTTSGTVATVNDGIGVGSSDNSFIADAGDNILIFGAQLEQSPIASSYIYTNGSPQIRFKDTLETDKLFDSERFESTAGTFFLSSRALGNTNTEYRICLSDGTQDNMICLRYLNNAISCFVTVAGTTQTTFSTQQINIDEFRNIALSWQEDRFEFYVDGEIVGEIDTTGDTFPQYTLDILTFYDPEDANFDFAGYVDELSIYDYADLDLEDLTAYSTFEAMATNFNYEVQ